MAINNGTAGMGTSYDLTVGQIVQMDEAIYMLDPIDTPLLTGMNSDGLAVLPVGEPVEQVQFSWMDESILLPRSQLAGAVTTGDAYITVQSGERLKFSTGDSIHIPKAGAAQEVLRVTGYGTTADTLLVTRGFGSSTATNYASGAWALGTGLTLPEGSDPEKARTSDRGTAYNVTQIFGPTLMHMSRTEQQIKRYGVANEFTHQLYNRTLENAIQREQAFLYGYRFNDSTTKIRQMGGLQFFLSQNVDSTSTQLTSAKIATLQQQVYGKGGELDILMIHPAALADIMAEDASLVRTTRVDTVRGRRPVMTVVGEFGEVTVVRNRWVNPVDAFLLRRGSVKRRVLQPFMAEALAKTGDSDRMQILSEESLEVKGVQHMARFSNLTYTP